jgi:hypothetical protein
MAKEEAKAPAEDKPKPQPADMPVKKKGGKFKFILVLIVACAAMPFTLPSILLLLAGFAPTYVAFATDDDPEKSGATCVGAMNLAGIVPFLIDLWEKGQTQENALRILTDSSAWVVILGAAAIGQLVVYAVPQAIATLSLTNADARVKGLRKNLELLKESWGQEVAAVKSAEKNAKG